MKTIFQYLDCKVLYLLMVYSVCTSCMKEFLDERYNYSQAIPQTLDDYQAFLDNTRVTNDGSPLDFGTLSADEFYVQNEIYNALPSEVDQNVYVWAKDPFGMLDIKEWDIAYKRILHCNIVIDGVEGDFFEPDDKDKKESILGTAYFVRALSYFELSQIFCKQYDSNTAQTDLGVPLRLTYDVSVVVKRSSIEEVYKQVLQDLKYAVDLLPNRTILKERPNKSAALGLLARVYLQQGNYEKAYEYAKLGLKESNQLLDFKTLLNLGEMRMDGTYFTFDGIIQTNPEVLYMSRTIGGSVVNNYIGGESNIDTLLLESYEPSDLRKKAYFYKDGIFDVFIGGYSGDAMLFTGIAVDELYLILAEAACRLGKLEESLAHLNILLIHRFDEFFIPLVISDKQTLLERILEERRKELVFRGTRWSDLRRLNQEVEFSRILYRRLNGKTYELQPNSSRYVFPIPYTSLLQSGLENNFRD